MGSPRTQLLGVIVALTAAAGGCTYNLDPPATLSFRGLTDADAKAVERALEGEHVRFTKERHGDTTLFHTNDLVTTARLGQVYEQIALLRTRDRIEFDFEGLTLAYSSLAASGSASTTATIQVSPGAIAYIAERDGPAPWRQIRIDSNGAWRGTVQTSQRVSRDGGWLYVAFSRDGKLFRFIRVNVLSGAQERSTLAKARQAGLSEPKGGKVSMIAKAGTPSDTPRRSFTFLRRSSADAKTDGKPEARTFRWPWQ